MVSENVQTDAAIAVDVGVVDASGEVDLGRLEGVVCGEVDGEEEDTARVWGVALRTVSHDVAVCCESGDGGVGPPATTQPGNQRLTGPMIVACQWNWRQSKSDKVLFRKIRVATRQALNFEAEFSTTYQVITDGASRAG